jgi:uncharacterized damage-inducible protein DinB
MGFIAEILERQYESCFTTMREVMEGCPEEEWRISDNPRFIPSRLTLHILETIEYYIGDSREFKESQFGDSEFLTPDTLPSEKSLREYFNEVRDKLYSKLRSLGDEEFLSPETLFTDSEDGYMLLDLYIYTLRHTQHHVGQLVEELRRRGIEGPRWH